MTHDALTQEIETVIWNICKPKVKKIMELVGTLKDEKLTCVGLNIVEFPSYWIQVRVEVFAVQELLNFSLFDSQRSEPASFGNVEEKSCLPTTQ